MLGAVTEIRAVGPDDWQVWRALRLTALAEAPYAFGAVLADWLGEGDREERWQARLSAAGCYHLLANADGAPVGMVSGVPGEDDAVELISMWVSPRMRRRGVAGELLREVEGWARASGAREVRVKVITGNEPAAALYQQHGYVDTGRRVPMPDRTRQEIVMVKPVVER